jgi:6-pyruvoyltetrahydropterin/6-carboxytetrahydropterin synthase
MHKLARRVRFSINPFLAEDSTGFNSYCSKPACEGLSVFFELTVELAGAVDSETGFVVNVADIDEAIRQNVVPVFSGHIRRYFREGKHTGLGEIADLLKKSSDKLKGKFAKAKIDKLSLSLNPFRKVAIDFEESRMIYFSEKFDFAATHKLWNEDFTEEQNFKVFGKCANPSGHGHNYVAEVTVKAEPGRLSICEFEKTVDENLIQLVDHKNLNVDVPYFTKVQPTVENLAVFAWERLESKFENAQLHCVNIQETDKTYCSYYGQKDN